MIYIITPVVKPRQTRSDKWEKRPCVMRYRAFADEARSLRIKIKPGDAIHFILPMPKTWSIKKKSEMVDQPVLSRKKFDIDNLLKSLLDACFVDDSQLWRLGPMSKTWGYYGRIEIESDIDKIIARLQREDN